MNFEQNGSCDQKMLLLKILQILYNFIVSTLDINGKFNDYHIEANAYTDKEQNKGESYLKMESPFRTLKLLFSGICRNTGSDITVMAETNNVRRFYFQKRSHTNTFTVELRDLFVSSAIKCTLTLDSFGENFSKQLTLGTYDFI